MTGKRIPTRTRATSAYFHGKYPRLCRVKGLDSGFALRRWCDGDQYQVSEVTT
ncbi:hypothetical protein SAMN04489731_106138 [Amycolatopsis regifaucium]|nr:hypothetical protein SAMN04489731_106138 [Amycolatopsis regifaucium]